MPFCLGSMPNAQLFLHVHYNITTVLDALSLQVLFLKKTFIITINKKSLVFIYAIWDGVDAPWVTPKDEKY